MRIRTAIYIEVDVADFIQAAEHQRKMERTIAKLKDDFPTLTHKLHQSRPYIRASNNKEPRKKMLRHTGNLSLYDERTEQQ